MKLLNSLLCFSIVIGLSSSFHNFPLYVPAESSNYPLFSFHVHPKIIQESLSTSYDGSSFSDANPIAHESINMKEIILPTHRDPGPPPRSIDSLDKSLMVIGNLNSELMSSFKDPEFMSWFERNIYSPPFHDHIFYPKPMSFAEQSVSDKAVQPYNFKAKSPKSYYFKPKLVKFNENDAFKKPSAYPKKYRPFKRPVVSYYYPEPLQAQTSINNNQDDQKKEPPDHEPEPYSDEVIQPDLPSTSSETYGSYEDYGSAEHGNSLEDDSSVEIEGSDSRKATTVSVPPRRKFFIDHLRRPRK